MRACHVDKLKPVIKEIVFLTENNPTKEKREMPAVQDALAYTKKILNEICNGDAQSDIPLALNLLQEVCLQCNATVSVYGFIRNKTLF